MPRYRPLMFVVGFGLALRLACLCGFYLAGDGKPEVWEYETIAANLLNGEGLTYRHLGSVYRSFSVPLFPAYCAALHWLGGPDFRLFHLVQLLLSGILLIGIFTIARSFFDDRAAIIAAALSASDPGLIVYQSYKLDVSLLASVLLVLSFFALTAAFRREAAAGAILAGLLTGVAALARPDAVALLGVPAIRPLWVRPVCAPARTFLAFAFGLALALLPWLARNHRLHGRILMSTTAGQLLWAGNNPKSTGTLWTREGTPMYASIPADLANTVRGAGELANHDVFKDAAFEYIRRDPLAALGRWSRNFFYFFSFAPDYSRRAHYPWAPGSLFHAYRAFFLVVTVVAVFGTSRAWKAGRRDVLLLWAVPVGLALIHSLHYVEGRHRLLALPFLYVLAAFEASSRFSRPEPGAEGRLSPALPPSPSGPSAA